MNPRNDAVEKWLSVCRSSTRAVYKGHIAKFESYMQKSASQILQEYRKEFTNPETADNIPQKVFEFYRALLDGEIKTQKRGHKNLGYTNKTYSQKAAKTIVSAVQSFFAFHNLPIKLKKFTAKDPRMRKPRVEHKKHQLLQPQIASLISVASIRDQAILSLGLMGQDESTIASLKIEQFEGKLSAEKLEIVECFRPKTNEELWILLTPEVQQIVAKYITSLRKNEGWLFSGYNGNSIKSAQCNKIFKQLCQKLNIKPQNSKRLTFHCCRMWFSAQLKNTVSDDLIDRLTGHTVRFEGAYLGDVEKTRELLEEAKVSELLTFVSEPPTSKQVEKKFAELEKRGQYNVNAIRTLTTQLNERTQTIDDLLKLTSYLKTEIEALKKPKP